ncbi:flagellar assembly protein FliH [Lentibacillus cibarius]|uniref:Flagellar assembly protein FliH n=1 Tax=Lentibacillus cibarius TaxID=2583219 RepID=A0A5S3QPI0_9BACI|nr:flagellar assembly protein FliH [Lentibacillus cibarius]
MTSLSSIYRGQTLLSEKKQIKLRPLTCNKQHDTEANQAKTEKQKMINDEITRAQNELEQIKKQQSELLQQTNAEIEAAKSEWEAERQQYMEQAHQEGFAQGFEQGKQEGLEQYRLLVEQANNTVSLATNDYHAVIAQSEEAILELAIQCAEKIIHQKLNDNPEAFLSIVRETVNELKDHSEIAIYVHPENFEMVTRQKDEFTNIFENDRKITVYADEELDEYSCLIEHSFGQIEAGIDTQLQQLRETLHEISLEQGGE